jgi:hypothetical protein
VKLHGINADIALLLRTRFIDESALDKVFGLVFLCLPRGGSEPRLELEVRASF